MNEPLGAVQTRPIPGDHGLAGTVALLGHRAERASGGHCGEEAVDHSKFPFDDERDKVVRKPFPTDEPRIDPSTRIFRTLATQGLRSLTLIAR